METGQKSCTKFIGRQNTVPSLSKAIQLHNIPNRIICNKFNRHKQGSKSELGKQTDDRITALN